MRTGLMRTINKIIVHCTDSDNPRVDIAEIRRWHVQERHFDDIGYHWVILSDAKAHAGRPEEIPGAHCEGHNFDSLGIAVHMKNIIHEDQMNALKELLLKKCKQYKILPENIFPHNQFSTKTCPNFDVSPFRAYVAEILKGV
jgi:N-acetylmuramoyl-L-alanine amidase